MKLEKTSLCFKFHKFTHVHIIIPHGLMARILGFHPRGPGSIPGVGDHFFVFCLECSYFLLYIGVLTFQEVQAKSKISFVINNKILSRFTFKGKNTGLGFF